MSVSNETTYERPPITNFEGKLNAILSTAVTVENIDTYADTALEGLIHLVADAESAYRQYPTVDYSSSQEQEDAAFAYFGLNDLNAILDHVAAKAEEIDGLEAATNSSRIVNEVIVPPSIDGAINVPDEPMKPGSFIEKAIQPRVKTILFVLANEFGIDIKDASQLTMIDGVVTEDMLRRTSYKLLCLPELKRTILACDESGNATYIFDNTELELAGVSSEQLLALTKPVLDSMLKANSRTGLKIKYSKDFVTDIVMGLRQRSNELAGATEQIQLEEIGTYLRLPVQPATEDEKSIGAFATENGVNHAMVARLALELGFDMPIRRFYSRQVPALTSAMQAELKKQPQISAEKAGKDDVSLKVYALSRSSSPGTLSRMVANLGLELPEKKFGGYITRAVTPEIKEQLDAIPIQRNSPEPSGKPRQPRAPKRPEAPPIGEGEVMIKQFAKNKGVDVTTVKTHLEAFGFEPLTRQRGANQPKVLNREMQEQLETLEVFQIKPAQPNDVSASEYAKSRGRDYKTTVKKIGELGFKMATRKFGRHNALALTPEIQEALDALPFFQTTD